MGVGTGGDDGAVGAQPLHSPSGPDRCDEGLDAHDLDHPLHIVGQHAQTYLGSDVSERLGEEVGAAHPGLERAEHVFNGSPADAHGIGQLVQSPLHGIDDRFMLPAFDALHLLGRTARPHCAAVAGAQVSVVVDVAVMI